MDPILPEVIITSSMTCSIRDAINGNELSSYKDDNTFGPKTLSLIGEDFLIGAYANKPMLKVWTISKSRKQEIGSFVIPGIVSVLSVSNCGNYCIAGIKEQIYVWEVSTGLMLMVLSRHYQPVTCLRFTDDDSLFISGGKDGHVIVWILSSVIDVTAHCATVKPQYVWNKHSGEVTDIYCGYTGSRVASTSVDMTCNIYELDSGILLTSICMDVCLTSVVIDLMENFIFLADDRGYMYKICTYERLPIEMHRNDVNNKVVLQLHPEKIISLAINSEGTLLMTASEDQTCKLWDIQSMACVLSMSFEGRITNAFFAIKPACLTDTKIVPQLRVRTFLKDMSAVGDGTKYVVATTQPKRLKLMHDGDPDKYFRDFLNARSSAAVEKSNAAAVAIEDVFTETVRGNSVDIVTKVNQQLFSVAVCEELDQTFDNIPSPP